MPLLPMVGHQEPRQRVAGALEKGRFPHSILVSGPQGVGKQRFALWVAQLLVCGRRGGRTEGRKDEPCGECASCRKVLGLAHPDVHWMVPIPRPKAGDPDRQVEEAAEALAEVMGERREQPLWTAPDGMGIHGVATARLILRRMVLTPVEGGPKVFIVGDAERLVPQESSPEAANALLKAIEEPPRDTVVILTVADPSRVLPTIRSRMVPLRLGRLSDEEVRSFLVEHLRPAPKGTALDLLVKVAEGSIGRALAEGAAAARVRETATALLGLIEEGKGRWIERALQQTPWQARGEFSELLAALGMLLEEQAKAAISGGKAEGRKDGRVEALVEAVERVEAAREAAQGNVNPQLLLAVLASDLEERLCD
jgi:DNA polymerase III subunit delta'